MFVAVSHFYPGLIFAGKAGANPSVFLALPTYNRLGRMCRIVTNTLAYSGMESITTVNKLKQLRAYVFFNILDFIVVVILCVISTLV